MATDIISDETGQAKPYQNQTHDGIQTRKAIQQEWGHKGVQGRITTKHDQGEDE